MRRVDLEQKLRSSGLKITRQRIAVLDAVLELNNHPTADEIITYLKVKHNKVSTGTIYKILDKFVDAGLIIKVKAEKDIMRYDGILIKHHHLHCIDSEKIIDYHNSELDKILDSFFKKSSIPGFEIHGIKLQIDGKLIK